MEFLTHYYFQYYFGSVSALLKFVATQRDTLGNGLSGDWVKAKNDEQAKKKSRTIIKKGIKMAEGLTRQEPSQPFCFVAIQLMTGRGTNERVIQSFSLNPESSFIPQAARQQLITAQLFQEQSSVN